jgi:AraC-like DNA-binding protein
MSTKAATVGIVTAPGNMPGIYLEKILRIVEQQGHCTAELRQSSQILSSLPDMASLAEIELTYAEYRGFVEAIFETFDIPGLGLMMGSQFRATDFGILGYAILSSRSLRAAIPIIDRYQQLWGGSPNLFSSYKLGAKISSQMEHSNHPPGKLQQFELEEAAAQFVSIRQLLEEPEKFRLLKVTFSFPKPTYINLFEEIFRCPIEFGQPHSELFFPTEMLDYPFSAANDLAQELCQQQCEKFLRQLEGEGGLTEQIRTAIIRSPGEAPSLTDLADSLNMSLRTLRRRLKAEGTTYKEVLTEIRMQLAKQYLEETPLCLKEIGYLLGYTEVANFQRAFKNWYEVTPREMRLKGNQTN